MFTQKHRALLFVISILLATNFAYAAAVEVTIPDPNLRAALEAALGKTSGETIFDTDLATLTVFEHDGTGEENHLRKPDHPGISDLTGLEYCINLTELNLIHNDISDISPLANLTNLTNLIMSWNQISDISPLTNLTNLTRLVLWVNQIRDIGPLANLTNMTWLVLDANQISDISPLANLTNLTGLGLEANQISDISTLASLTNLDEVNLRNDKISDLGPLVDNAGLDTGDAVDVLGNPLTPVSLNTHIPTLQARGVNVQFDSTAITIPDANLRAALEAALGKKPGETIFDTDLATLTVFEHDGSGDPPSERRPDHPTIFDLTGLEYCTNLTELNLTLNQIRDISPLANLTNLTNLDLRDNNQLRDISPLANLTNLTWLGLLDNDINDINPLANLTNLTQLNLGDNQINDISPLGNLTNLTVLHLPGNQIRDISPLANLTRLTELHLNVNQIRDLSPLANLTNLTKLNLRHNEISDISPLANLTNLTNLDLKSNQISDIIPLVNLTNLTELHLNVNQISDLSPLANLTNLTTLALESNQINDISPLANLTNLTYLRLDGNQIRDIGPLANLTRLGEMDLTLRDNQISDLQPLVDNPGLDEGDRVDVRDNPLNSFSLDRHIPALQARGVDVLFDVPSVIEVVILDPNLRAALEAALGKPPGETIFDTDLATLTVFEHDGSSDADEELRKPDHPGISDLTGLEYCINLVDLNLIHNDISDISPLVNLTNLTFLQISWNRISDINPLANLTNLTFLQLHDNEISDISPLANLTRLGEPWSDIDLNLRDNQISDLQPLVDNPGLDAGDGVDVRGNPLNSTSLNTHIPTLQARGVNVLFDALAEIAFQNQPPAQMIAGGTFPFILAGKDTDGQTVALPSDVEVIWGFDGEIIGTINPQTGQFTAKFVGAGKITATFRSDATIKAESNEIAVIAAPASDVQISSTPASLTAGSGETTEVRVTVTDEFGNPSANERVSLSVSLQNGAITPTATHQGDGVYTGAYTAGGQVGIVLIQAQTATGVTGGVTLTLTKAGDEPPPTTAELVIFALKPEATTTAGGIATYTITLEGKNGFASAVTLLDTELPPNVSAAFDPKQVTLSPADPLATSELTLTLPDPIAPGDYPFTVLAIPQGKQLDLTLKVESTAERIPTSLTFITQPQEVPFMGMVNLFGILAKLTDEPLSLGGVTIQIDFTAPSGVLHTFEAVTDADGDYQLAQPFTPDEAGRWDVKARFAGSTELEASEQERTFTVTKGIAKITFQSGTTGALGTEIEIVGRLDPGLDGVRLTLKILRPDGSASTLTDITTESLGVFRHSLKLELAGDWTISATWSGNDRYEGATQMLTISVSVGKVILVLGGGNRDDNPAWERFNAVAEYVHNILLKRQFDAGEDIQFLSPDPTQTEGADTETTLGTLELAITDWAKSQVNPKAPLLLYLLSHNLRDRFLLEKRGNSETFLSPALLDEWLSKLPPGTPVTIIIEACHSGNFISGSNGTPTRLVGLNRTIIVSARGDKQAKILRNRSSFSKTFFDQIDANKTVAEAFREAEAKMKRTPLHRDQFPQIDADGNGVVNEAQDFAAVANRYLPADIVSLGDPPEFIKLTEATTLAEGISSLRIESELLGVGLTRVFATVIPPDFDPTRRVDSWDAFTFDEFDLAEVSEGKYAAAYANFTIPGDYTVIVNAENPDGSADPVQTTITVPGGEKPETPWDVNADGAVNVFDLVLVGSQFGQAGANLSGDVNGNGVVDVFDLVLVGSHFGESTIAAAPSAFIGIRSDVHGRFSDERLKTSRQDSPQSEPLRRALAELEAMPNPSRGAAIAIEFLRAWLANTNPIVTETKLLPNYPNPFNPETWIPYQLVSDAAVEISIYDISGTLVRRLNLGHQPVGYYATRDRAAYWDGKNETGEMVSSGVYFYHLKAGDFDATKKMLLMK